MAYIVDTTLGLILAIWLLKALDYFANKHDWASLKDSGVYEGVDGIMHWSHQVLAWLIILSIVKAIIFLFMITASGLLAQVGAFLFAPLERNIRFELLFVMIFFPGFLNVIYFWIADSFLQAKASTVGAHEDEEAEAELAKKKVSLLADDEKLDPGQWTRVDV